jgi:hypothetical protein
MSGVMPPLPRMLCLIDSPSMLLLYIIRRIGKVKLQLHLFLTSALGGGGGPG